MKTKTPLHRIAALFALALLATFGATHEAKAQYQITTLGGSITETFTNYNGTAAPTTGNWVFNSNNTSGTKPGFSGQGNGTGTAGNVWSYGVANASDRALGFLGSGNAGQNMNAFAEVQNNISSGTVTSLVVSWTGEMWRSVSAATSAITVAYAIGTKGVTSAATLGGLSWTNLNTYTPTQLANNQNGSLANSQSFNSGTVNLASFNNTQSIYIRVYYLGGGGTRAGLAIDDLSVTFNGAAASPGNFWAGAAGGGGSGIWTSTSTNWATGADGAGRGGTQATSGALVFTNTAGNVDVGDPVTVNAGMQFATDGYTVRSNTITLAGANAAANTITTDASVGTTINSVLAGSTGMTKAGAGTLTLGGTNTYSGGTLVSAGRLVGSTASLQGTITNNAAVTFNQTADGTYASAMSGTGSMVKSGSATLTMSGVNTFSGATTISAGELAVNGTNANSAVTVSSGAALSGSGQVGALTVSGSISPGNSIGILDAGNTVFDQGGSFLLEVYDWTGAAGTGWDLLDITGSLTLSNTVGNKFTINLTSFSSPTTPGTSINWNQNVNWTNTFVDYTSLVGSFSSDLFAVNTSNFLNPLNGSFSITNVGTTLALLYTTSFVPSGDYTWSTGSGLWGTAGNWTNNATPTNGANILFSGAGGSSTNSGTVSSVQGLLFSNSAGSYTVSGDALTVGALGIDNESTAAQTINNNLTLGVAQTFNAAAGNLTFGGTIDNNSNLLTIAGNSNTVVSGAISGSGGLTKSGTGSLTLGGNNSYTGALSANGGTTLVNGTQAATTINVGGGTLLLGASDVLANGATVALTTGTINLGTFSDTISAYSQVAGTITNGSLAATTYSLTGGTMGASLNSGAVTVGGTVALSGTITNGASVNIASGSLTYGSANRLGDNVTVTNNGGTLDMATFSDTISTYSQVAGTITNGSLAATTYSLTGGTMGAVLNGGAVTVGGTVALSGTITNGASVTITNGTLTFGASDRISTDSSVTLNGAGATLNLGGFSDLISTYSQVAGTITNGSLAATTYSLAGGTIAADLNGGAVNVSGAVALSGTITNGATVLITNSGTLTLGSANRISENSTVTVNGGTLDMATFSDTISIYNQVAGTITNGSLVATTYNLGGGTIGSNAALGAGTANVTNGVVALNGTLAATTLNISGGTLGLGANARIDNATVVNLSSGSLNMSTFSDGVGTFNMTGGTVDGTGTLTASNGLAIQAGTINANIGSSTVAISNGATTINGSVGGAVTVSSGTADLNGALASSLTASGGTVNLSNTVAGNVTVSGGTVNLGSADRIGNSSAVNVSSGSLNLNGNDSVGAVTLTGGTIGGSGKLTGASFNVQSGAISVGIDGSGAMTKTGSGSTTLSGDSSTYNGNVTVGGGALIAANNNALGSAAVTMTNGSLFAASGVTNANTITIGTAGGGGFVTNSFSSTTVAGWDFSTNAGGTGNFGPSPMAATTNAEGVSIVGLTRGSGVTTAGSGAANAWGGDGWSTSNNATAAIADGDFAFFSVTVSNGFALNLTNFGAYNVRRSGSGPTTGLWQWSTNGVDFVDIGSAITWGNVTSGSAGNPQSAISFTNINQLQGLGSGSTVTFRVANYGASGTGTWYLNDPNDTTALDFLLNGQIATVTGGGAASGSGTLGISEAGTATFSGNIVNNNEATFTAASGGLATFSGTVSGEGTLNKTGAGTVTLSGASANTFTGLTTVSAGTLELNKTADTAAIAGDIEVNDGAFLLLSSSGNVADTAEITLSGGTITRGAGVSEVFGALTLGLTGGTLDFGTGATGTLGFGEYAPSALLTINNFGLGNTLTFGSDLSGSINNTALFSFDNGFNSSWNSGTSTFTITAIPEPSTYLAAAGLLSLMLWPSRKRLLKDAKKIIGMTPPMRDRLAAKRI